MLPAMLLFCESSMQELDQDAVLEDGHPGFHQGGIDDDLAFHWPIVAFSSEQADPPALMLGTASGRSPLAVQDRGRFRAITQGRAHPIRPAGVDVSFRQAPP